MVKHRKSIAAALLVLNACYTTVPLATDNPSQGTDLTVTLTDAGGVQMASVLGPKTSGLSGRYLGQSGDSIFLGVSAVMQQNGNEVFWQGERVGIPRSTVATMRERKFSAAKSGAIAGALVAILVGITSIVSSGSPGQKGNPPPKGQ